MGLCEAEVDTGDNNGSTPLFYAVTLGHAECTNLLLSFGADPNRQDKKGRRYHLTNVQFTTYTEEDGRAYHTMHAIVLDCDSIPNNGL